MVNFTSRLNDNLINSLYEEKEEESYILSLVTKGLFFEAIGLIENIRDRVEQQKDLSTLVIALKEEPVEYSLGVLKDLSKPCLREGAFCFLFEILFKTKKFEEAFRVLEEVQEGFAQMLFQSVWVDEIKEITKSAKDQKENLLALLECARKRLSKKSLQPLLVKIEKLLTDLHRTEEASLVIFSMDPNEVSRSLAVFIIDILLPLGKVQEALFLRDKVGNNGDYYRRDKLTVAIFNKKLEKLKETESFLLKQTGKSPSQSREIVVQKPLIRHSILKGLLGLVEITNEIEGDSFKDMVLKSISSELLDRGHIQEAICTASKMSINWEILKKIIEILKKTQTLKEIGELLEDKKMFREAFCEELINNHLFDEAEEFIDKKINCPMKKEHWLIMLGFEISKKGTINQITVFVKKYEKIFVENPENPILQVILYHLLKGQDFEKALEFPGLSEPLIEVIFKFLLSQKNIQKALQLIKNNQISEAKKNELLFGAAYNFHQLISRDPFYTLQQVLMFIKALPDDYQHPQLLLYQLYEDVLNEGLFSGRTSEQLEEDPEIKILISKICAQQHESFNVKEEFYKKLMQWGHTENASLVIESTGKADDGMLWCQYEAIQSFLQRFYSSGDFRGAFMFIDSLEQRLKNVLEEEICLEIANKEAFETESLLLEKLLSTPNGEKKQHTRALKYAWEKDFEEAVCCGLPIEDPALWFLTLEKIAQKLIKEQGLLKALQFVDTLSDLTKARNIDFRTYFISVPYNESHILAEDIFLKEFAHYLIKTKNIEEAKLTIKKVRYEPYKRDLYIDMSLLYVGMSGSSSLSVEEDLQKAVLLGEELERQEKEAYYAHLSERLFTRGLVKEAIGILKQHFSETRRDQLLIEHLKTEDCLDNFIPMLTAISSEEGQVESLKNIRLEIFTGLEHATVTAIILYIKQHCSVKIQECFFKLYCSFLSKNKELQSALEVAAEIKDADFLNKLYLDVAVKSWAEIGFARTWHETSYESCKNNLDHFMLTALNFDEAPDADFHEKKETYIAIVRNIKDTHLRDRAFFYLLLVLFVKNLNGEILEINKEIIDPLFISEMFNLSASLLLLRQSFFKEAVTYATTISCSITKNNVLLAIQESHFTSYWKERFIPRQVVFPI